MAVRRLRILTTGPDGNYSPGQVLIIDTDQATALVGGGHAIYADDPETAVPSVAPKPAPKRGRR